MGNMWIIRCRKRKILIKHSNESPRNVGIAVSNSKVGRPGSVGKFGNRVCQDMMSYKS